MADQLHILYFAWLRERVGTGEESVTLPDDVRTVAALIAWLKTRSPGHSAAFEPQGAIRCAVNEEFAQATDAIRPGDEVAFFPPVTGG